MPYPSKVANMGRPRTWMNMAPIMMAILSQRESFITMPMWVPTMGLSMLVAHTVTELATAMASSMMPRATSGVRIR